MMKMNRSASPYSSFETSCEDEIIAGEFEYYGEKKLKCRRLNMEQVRALEKSFELGKRLEPERKLKLARALGLHPRQIAIWFQNRRARWKTKQLEKDFGVLKQDYEAFKAHYHNLQEENKKLQAEIQRLNNIFKNENGEKVGVEAENMKAMDEGIGGALQFGSCGQEQEVGSASSLDGSINHRVLAKMEQNMAEQTEETCFYGLDEKTRFLWDHWP